MSDRPERHATSGAAAPSPVSDAVGGLSFLFHEDVQRIFNNFTALFQIRIAFFSPDGREIKVGQDRALCRYCSLIRQCPGGEEACEEQDRRARLDAAENQELKVYVCHGGMTEAVKPLYDEDRLIGFAMIGQIRRSESAPPRWLNLHARAAGTSQLQKAYEEQPMRRNGEMERILEFFSDIMDLIAAQGLIRSRGGDRMSELLVWIKEHLEKELALADAAEEFHLSTSRLSHLVKERFGCSYTRLVRRLRMERACLVFSHRADTAVQDCARSVGYGDPLYFSRHFKEFTGLSPNQYKKQQNNP